MPFDYVKYTNGPLSGEIGSKIGEVVKAIPTGGYVVDFGGEGYVVDGSHLVKHSFADSDKSKGPEIVRRRRYEADDE